MAYVLSYSLGSIIVNDTTLNTQTSLSIPGLNYEPYGEPVDQNFILMLENFAGANPPANPIPGQTWYNSTTRQLNINTSTNLVADWTPLGSGNGDQSPGGPNTAIQYNLNSNFAGSSAFTFNPSANTVTVAGNVSATYFIGDGGFLSNVGVSDYSNANVAAYLPTYLPTYTGNLSSGNAQLGNTAVANFFVGNGSALTGMYGNAQVANYLPTYTGNLRANDILVLGNLTVDGDIIHEGDSFNDGNLTVSGNITANGNVVTDNIYSSTGDIHIRSIGSNNNVYLWPTGPNGIVDVGNTLIANLSLLPLQADEATSKHYVDLLAQGIRPKLPAQCVANQTLESITGGTVVYDNGASGVGATLTMSNPLTVVDGYTILAGDRILINGQSNEAYNGVYIWTAPGTVITRSPDADQDTPDTEWPEGTFLFVDDGTQYANTGWVLVTEVLIIGTSPIKFHQVSQAGEYTAGTGLDLVGTQFSIVPTGVTAGVYGNGRQVPTLTVNSEGQIVNATQTPLEAAGATGQIQYNTGDQFDASARLTFDTATNQFSVLGNITVSSNITATETITANRVTANLLTGVLTTAAQPNITSVGTLTGLTVSSTINGSVSGTAATVTTAAQPNITSVGTLTGLSVSSTINGSINGIASSAATATTAGTVTTAAQPNITSVGTLTGLTVSSTINGSVSGSAGSAATATTATTATTAGTVTTAAQPNITSVGTLTGLTVSGTAVVGTVQTATLTTGSSATAGSITGNWTLTAGSILEATYADLAEKYVADQAYPAGTVLEFGGTHEVTLAEDETRRVAGVVSTNPAYIMNGECAGDHVVLLAMIGRVPCRVRGTIRKGDLLCSAGDGYARPTHQPKVGTIIGKALEDYDGVDGVIEIVVGKV